MLSKVLAIKILKSFELFGFGSKFVQWVKVLMENNVSSIHYGGWLFDWFNLGCGMRQGCSFSPLCFILACEVLSCKLDNAKK